MPRTRKATQPGSGTRAKRQPGPAHPFHVLLFALLALSLLAGPTIGQPQTGRRILEWTRLLQSDDPMRRSSAATSLLATHDSDALKTLFKAMAPDQREEVRISVITAFEVMRDDRAVIRLIDAIEDKSEKVRNAAVSALQACYTPKAVLLLEEAGADAKRSSAMRAKIIGILGEMRSMDSIPTLIRILSDGDPSIRKAANAALERITLRSFASVREWQGWWARSQRMTRAEMLEELVKRQADRLRSMGQRMEELELLVLKDRKDPKDAALLLKSLAESDSRKVKLYVLEQIAAGGHTGKPVVAALMKALEDPDASVRQKSVEALGGQKDQASIPQLVTMLTDPAPPVRAAAARALGGLKAKEAVDPLCEQVMSQIEEVAAAAALALGQIADRKAVDPLTEVVAKASTPAAVQEAAATALAKIKDPKAIPVLRKLLASKNERIRWSAVDALGGLQAKDAVGDLATVVRKDANPQIREHALAALARIGDPKGLDAVVDALPDKEERVAAQAFRSLTALADANNTLYVTAVDRLLAARQYALAEKVAAQAVANYNSKPNHAKDIANLRLRVARGLADAKNHAKARPYFEALVAGAPDNPAHAKELLACLQALGDRKAQLSLLSQARKRFAKDASWWQETVRVVTEIEAQGDAKQVLAIVAALEKESAALGGAKTAAALRALKAKATIKLQPVPKPTARAPAPEPAAKPAAAPAPAPKVPKKQP